MSYSLLIYKNKKEINNNKKLTRYLQRLLLIKLENWKDYKLTRGIIEDFFNLAKGTFGLEKFHVSQTDPCTKTYIYAYYYLQ